MKALAVIICCFAMVFLCSCVEDEPAGKVVAGSDSNVYYIVSIDSCEYIVSRWHGYGGYYYSMAHKGNCTNCFRLRKILEKE